MSDAKEEIMTNRKETTHPVARVALGSLGPDELKSLFSTAFVSMKIHEGPERKGSEGKGSVKVSPCLTCRSRGFQW